MNILVTGGGGYIGSHIVKRLLREGHRVVTFDNFSRGWREPLELLAKYGSLKVYEGDLRNIREVQSIFNKEKIDAVMHLAALCNVNESIKNRELYFENNVLGTRNLVQAMEQNKVDKIIYSSTCAVYGEAKYLPVDENHPTMPLNPYGESKLKVEELIQKSALRHVILRYFNVCGADRDGEIGDSKSPQELLVQNGVRAGLGIDDFILTSPKVATPDGTPIRDYIDVLDIVDAHIKALYYLSQRGQGGKDVILNLGTGRGLSVKEILDAVKKELGKEFKINSSPNPREGETSVVYANSQKAKKILAWTPKRSLSDSIQSLKKWYEQHPQGFKK